MTQEEFKNEREIRRFLLGEMPATERTAFEKRFIAEDAGLFDEIRVAEDELIESYLRATLSAPEKQKFEQNFLTTKERRQRVSLTREMFAKLAAEKESVAGGTKAIAENPPVWIMLATLFKTPKFAFGAALAVLFLVFGLWLLVFKSSDSQPPIAQQLTPTPTVSQTSPKVDEDKNLAVDLNVNLPDKPENNKTPSNINTDNLNKNLPEEVISKPVVATIVLFAGTLRSEGKMSILELTRETKGANFELNLETSDYKTYRAEIVDADGAIVYRSGKITARKSRIKTFFPTAKLKKGDYFVKVYGFNAAGKEESAADFQFRVNQK